MLGERERNDVGVLGKDESDEGYDSLNLAARVGEDVLVCKGDAAKYETEDCWTILCNGDEGRLRLRGKVWWMESGEGRKTSGSVVARGVRCSSEFSAIVSLTSKVVWVLAGEAASSSGRRSGDWRRWDVKRGLEGRASGGM